MPLERGQDHQFQFGDVDVGEVGQLGGSRHSWEFIPAEPWGGYSSGVSPFSALTGGRFLAWIWAFKPWLALGDGLVGDLEGLQDLGFADSAAENAIPRLGDLALERGLIHGAEQARLMCEVLVEALAGERRNWVSRNPFFLRPGFASPIVCFCAIRI